MRKIITLLAITVTVTLNAFGQKIDTLSIDSSVKVLKIGDKAVSVKDLFKKDTVVRIGYVIEKKDTSVIAKLTYIQGNRIRKCSPGYVVLSRSAITFDGKNYQWIGEGPVLVATLDNRKKPVKAVTQ